MVREADLGNRVAVIDGLRTPFAKPGTAYKNLNAQQLGSLVVAELLQRSGVAPKEIDRVVFGQVLPSLAAPNIAREIVLNTGMRRDVDGFSVSRACATGYQATVSVAEAIMAGDIDAGIAGGADSVSDIPIAISKNLADALVHMNGARTMADRLRAFRHIKPRDLIPAPPALKEPSTGLTMGESAEKMAKQCQILRSAQDEYAHRSHTLAAKGWAEGRLADQVMTVYIPPTYDKTVAIDNLVRKDSKIESYVELKPAFDRKHGTITAGNSSPLTDGASALLLMRASKADALGLRPIGFVKGYASVALDPAGQLLMGPALATPKVLDRLGMSLADIDLIDMHEAFAAQVLANVQAFASKAWARDKLGRSEPIGEVNWDRFNVNGGSIAMGHPFAATGGRQILQTLHELKWRGGEVGLCTACAAGGLGAAMVLEVA